MRYTLIDFQKDAATDALVQLSDARFMLEQRKMRSYFALNAATGAGKTVISSAIIEALFFGSAELNMEPDPNAVVLWFSDDPSLNEQSLARIRSASSELNDRLRIIEPSFSQEQLLPRNVYFLNAQKLSKGALLVRGAVPLEDDAMFDRPDGVQSLFARPDNAQSNIYDVLRNTIESGTNLYFFIDEAHRGMNNTKAKERKTIVQKLINGDESLGLPAMPVVFGISATLQRFLGTMENAENRAHLQDIKVDPARVQESGLLKDTISIIIPDESRDASSIFLKNAVDALKKSEKNWNRYKLSQGIGENVSPLMIIQVEDKVSESRLLEITDTVLQEYPELNYFSFAHVFAEHSDIDLGGQRFIRYIAPEQVQDIKHIRVLFAKNAITTGWDCPRAEVLVSFRAARDETYVTQMLGRMVRTPLARRIEGNELLNSVTCILPKYDKKTAHIIANRLMQGDSDNADSAGSEEMTGRRVLIDPVNLVVNPAISENVWEAFDKLPTQTIPKGTAKPIQRLTTLATALAKDGLKVNAVDLSYELLENAVKGGIAQFKDEYDAALKQVNTMHGRILTRNWNSAATTESTFAQEADEKAITESFNRAGRIISPALAGYLVDNRASAEADDEELLEAQAFVAAVGKVERIVSHIERTAAEVAKEWFTETRIARKSLSDKQKTEYDRLEAQAAEPELTDIVRPQNGQASPGTKDANGHEVLFPMYPLHLLATDEGLYPTGSENEWENHVIKTELERGNVLGWYRNPSRPSKDSFAIPYLKNNKFEGLRPDFIFFTQGNNRVDVNIVDPHGDHLADALPKLIGLADFAENYGQEIHRIEGLARIDGVYRVLDLKEPRVRSAVREATEAKTLYVSDAAADYR